MKKVVVAYIPVLHEGYRKFLEKHSDVDVVYVFGETLIAEFDYLAKEIRQLSPNLIKDALDVWGIAKKIEVIEKEDLKSIDADVVIMPNEDVCHDVAKNYFKDIKIEFDTVFLRWDKHNVMESKPVKADQTISREAFDREVISKLSKEAEKSSDWWRRIASAIVKDGEVVLSAHNEHMPSPHSPYVDGDPRNTLHKGIGTDIATAIHGEARLIAEAAQRGISLNGASLYVTVFPCSLCAKQIAFSGIKKIYYGGGYQMLDQERVLRAKGITIIYVEPHK